MSLLSTPIWKCRPGRLAPSDPLRTPLCLSCWLSVRLWLAMSYGLCALCMYITYVYKIYKCIMSDSCLKHSNKLLSFVYVSVSPCLFVFVIVCLAVFCLVLSVLLLLSGSSVCLSVCLPRASDWWLCLWWRPDHLRYTDYIILYYKLYVNIKSCSCR